MPNMASEVNVLVFCNCWKQWNSGLHHWIMKFLFILTLKAFDSVTHRRLLTKLKAYGIRGQILDWIEDFLTDRRQRVKIGCSNSDWSDILSGVPQEAS